MFPNRLALPLLAVACVTAAAAGGYFAARQNAVPAPAAAQSQPADFAAPSAAASKPVQETEALVGDVKPSSAPAPAPVASPAPPVRSKTTRRSEQTAPARPSTPAAAPQRERTTTARQEPPPLTSSWPSSAGSSSAQSSTSQTPATSSSASDANAGTTRAEAIQEAPRAPEPPQKTFEELVVSANSVIGLQTETRLSSDTAKVEDRVDAKVSRDVRVGDKIAIPAGSKAVGSVILVERGGKFKDRARIGIRFHTLELADGTRVPINTEAIYR